MLQPTENGARYDLASPTAMPNAGGFLWNRRMMIQVTCRGYATAQFMQPEPAKYSHAPNLEAKTFMQPEQAYYAHHPGRFFYVKDEETGEIFSAPHEPVRAAPDRFSFSVGRDDLAWTVERLGIRIDLRLGVPVDDVAELWTLTVTNVSGRPRKVSVYPYFTIGYMSWMNQSAEYRANLGGIVASSVTPYQKLQDYFRNKDFKDKTYFLCETAPDAWEANQGQFEGEGGLHAPDALRGERLAGGDARYETPVAAVQYRFSLDADAPLTRRFLFGPARDDAEIAAMKQRYLGAEQFAAAARDYAAYADQGAGCVQVETPDAQRRLSSDSSDIVKSLQSLGFQIDKVTVRQVQPQVQAQGQPQAQSTARDGSAGGFAGQGGAFSMSGQSERQAGQNRQGSGNGYEDASDRGGIGMVQTASDRLPGRGVFI